MSYIYARLIQLFRDNPNRVLSKQFIYEQVWEVPWQEMCEQLLHQTISQNRHLLSGEVKSVRGVGYIYLPEDFFHYGEEIA